MKNSIVMIYGPHEESCFPDLSDILKKQITNLKKNFVSIESIIEYNGPYYAQFLQYFYKFKSEKPEIIFDMLKDFYIDSLNNYVSTGNASYSKVYKNKYNFSMSKMNPFIKNLLDLLIKEKINIHCQNPSYNDYIKIHPYLAHSKSHFPECIRSFFYIYNSKYTEQTFRNQIKKIEQDNKNKSSFIIVRGAFHKFYYSCIQKEFKKDFNVNNITYFTLPQLMKDFLIKSKTKI